jgi:hypothetical protein
VVHGVDTVRGGRVSVGERQEGRDGGYGHVAVALEDLGRGEAVLHAMRLGESVQSNTRPGQGEKGRIGHTEWNDWWSEQHALVRPTTSSGE